MHRRSFFGRLVAALSAVLFAGKAKAAAVTPQSSWVHVTKHAIGRIMGACYENDGTFLCNLLILVEWKDGDWQFLEDPEHEPVENVTGRLIPDGVVLPVWADGSARHGRWRCRW